jgi:hypothetical protein
VRLALALLLLASPSFAQDQVWTWSDESGEQHFTNDKSTIPEKFRSKAKSTAGDELSIVKTREGTADKRPAEVITPTKSEPIEKSAPAAPRGKAGPVRAVLFEAATNSLSKTLNKSGVLDRLVSNNPGLRLERVEYATAVDRAERLKVTQVPTVLFVDDSDTVLTRTTGLATLSELQALLDKARGPVP